MNDNVLVGLVVGLLIGGAIGTLVMAVVAAGSEQRLSRAMAKGTAATDAANPSGPTWPESSMHVDLLADLEDTTLFEELPAAEVDDIDQEMRELMRRHERPSES
jgi:uncharacterized membrane protein